MEIDSSTYGYDSVGNVSGVADAGGMVTHREHDALGRIIRQRFGNGTEETFSYTPTGQMSRSENAAGFVPGRTIFEYDVLNRLSALETADGDRTLFEYDPVGHHATRTLPNGTSTSYDYCPTNRLLGVQHSSVCGAFESYDYQTNAVGDFIRVTNADGSYATFEYDALRRLTQERYLDFAGSSIDVCEF